MSFSAFVLVLLYGFLIALLVRAITEWTNRILYHIRCRAYYRQQAGQAAYHYVRFIRYVDGKSRPTTVQIPIYKWRQLVALTHREDTAERLIEDLVLTYPGQKASWYCEKALWDLERDRK